jgi:CRP/FNR family transcriptional regulator, cyclic AMP receptor protein
MSIATDPTIWIEALGYFGALVTLGTYSMKRMIPLRVLGICANCVFIGYGFLGPVYPQLVLQFTRNSFCTALFFR